MKHRYEEQPKLTWMQEFICAFFAGATGIFNMLGWVLVYFELVNLKQCLLISAIGGAMFAYWIATKLNMEKKDAGEGR